MLRVIPLGLAGALLLLMPTIGFAEDPTTSEKAEKVEKPAGVDTTEPTEAKTSCSKGTDTRTIANEPVSGGGCEVKYTKGGETSSVANAKVDTDHCNKVMEKIKKNLSDSGYTCK